MTVAERGGVKGHRCRVGDMSHPVPIRRTTVDGHESALRELVAEYYEKADEWARDYFPEELDGLDIEEAVEEDISRLQTADIANPLFVALDGDTLAGSVQLKRLDESTAEVKRLYVRPQYQSEGIGRRLMETVIEEADEDGFDTLRLGVGPYLERAQRLYESLGFEFTPPYPQTGAPEAIHDDWCFMRLDVE
jgi:ribosomal protein S18 acetylase RimI-like enzyme